MNKVALIDADSLHYMLAWNFRPKDGDDEFMDSPEEKEIKYIEALDQTIISILQAVEATHYIGAIGHPTEKCFRVDVAKFRPYKGNRKEELPIFTALKPAFRKRCMERWGFLAVPGLEADDVCSLSAQVLKEDTDVNEYIVCSPDKDLRQIPGVFYDYKKLDFGEVTPAQSKWLLYYQMIVGDGTDGVAGIPRKGSVAAKKALDHLIDEPDAEGLMWAVVMGMYLEYFGDHYGKAMFQENKAVLELMTREHLFFDSSWIEICLSGLRPVPTL